MKFEIIKYKIVKLIDREKADVVNTDVCGLNIVDCFRLYCSTAD
jgi:hypothetical protein